VHLSVLYVVLIGQLHMPLVNVNPFAVEQSQDVFPAPTVKLWWHELQMLSPKRQDKQCGRAQKNALQAPLSKATPGLHYPQKSFSLHDLQSGTEQVTHLLAFVLIL